MALDRWDITGGTSDYLELTILIDDVSYLRNMGIGGISTQVQGLAVIRDYVTQLRDEIHAKETVPPAVASAIGYGEEF